MKAARPYCCKCFEKIHVEYCASCGKSIGVEQGQITYEDQHWHAADECFKCFTCAKSLRGGLMFIPKHGVIYCSNNCLKQKSLVNKAPNLDSNVKSSPINSPSLNSKHNPSRLTTHLTNTTNNNININASSSLNSSLIHPSHLNITASPGKFLYFL